jgi:hypothetical protein
MTEDDINWILNCPKESLERHMESVNWVYHPNYRAITKSMGRDSWTKVLCGLNKRINKSVNRAYKMDFDHDIRLPDLSELWIKQKGRCDLTGVIMNFDTGTWEEKNHNGCSIDRIDSKKGYVKGNVRLLTHWANNALNTWPDDVFNFHIEKAYHRMKKINTADCEVWHGI